MSHVYINASSVTSGLWCLAWLVLLKTLDSMYRPLGLGLGDPDHPAGTLHLRRWPTASPGLDSLVYTPQISLNVNSNQAICAFLLTLRALPHTYPFKRTPTWVSDAIACSHASTTCMTCVFLHLICKACFGHGTACLNWPCGTNPSGYCTTTTIIIIFVGNLFIYLFFQIEDPMSLQHC